MLASLLAILSKAKVWLVAIAGAIGAFLAAYLYGKSSQKANDKEQAKQVVHEQLNKIKETSNDVKADVQNNPATGPGSSTDQLQNDWSRD